jgi:hypothetical protein
MNRARAYAALGVVAIAVAAIVEQVSSGVVAPAIHAIGVAGEREVRLHGAGIEAANCAIRILYHGLYPNKGHGRAVVAVARHLAEASYWVLRKKQYYRAPRPRITG